jgi:hypothetical protein
MTTTTCGDRIDRIDRARTAWKAQTLPRIPTDQDEFVPYPEPQR